MKTKISFFVPRNWKNIVITRGPLNCCKTLWQFIICECRRDPSRNRYTPENEWMSPKEEPIFERELHLPTSNHPFSAKKNVAQISRGIPTRWFLRIPSDAVARSSQCTSFNVRINCPNSRPGRGFWDPSSVWEVCWRGSKPLLINRK